VSNCRNDIWEELFEHEEIMCEAVEIVEKRIQGGDYFLTANLVKLLASTKSRSLYELIKKDIFTNDWALIDLLRSEFPDPEIETSLLGKLYGYAGDDGEPRRKYIVEALRVVGTREAIPTLEAILHDLTDTVATKRLIADAVDAVSPDSIGSILASVEFGSRREFVELVAKAISEVKQRGVSSVTSVDVDMQVMAVDFGSHPDVKNAVFELERAKNLLRNDDPISAVVSLRRGGEALGKHLYRYLGMEVNGRPAKTMMFKGLLKPVKDSDVPDVFKLCFEALQLFGNFTTHDQDEGHLYFNLRVANAILVLYEEALDIYSSWTAAGGSSVKE
jgi:hypothetical protein